MPMSRRKLGIVLLTACLLSVAMVGLAQNTTVPGKVPGAEESAGQQALTYIDSVATYLGQGVVYLLNLVTNDRVSTDLYQTIGYLALITLVLILFGLLDAARKIIWVGIIVGWVLLIIRIVLDALNL
ncbi:hypothetical protein JW848_06910 [Candidatus Bipolaricaulota bacterium]|nr:hypothetical protein [Candidatus Bipolaricaulota bacterium]